MLLFSPVFFRVLFNVLLQSFSGFSCFVHFGLKEVSAVQSDARIALHLEGIKELGQDVEEGDPDRGGPALYS